VTPPFHQSQNSLTADAGSRGIRRVVSGRACMRLSQASVGVRGRVTPSSSRRRRSQSRARDTITIHVTGEGLAGTREPAACEE